MEEKIIAMIAEHLGVDAGKIKLESDFEKDLDADSLDTADLFLAAREEFGVKVKEEEIVEVKTVRDLVQLIEKKTKKKK